MFGEDAEYRRKYTLGEEENAPDAQKLPDADTTARKPPFITLEEYRKELLLERLEKKQQGPIRYCSVHGVRCRDSTGEPRLIKGRICPEATRLSQALARMDIGRATSAATEAVQNANHQSASADANSKYLTTIYEYNNAQFRLERTGDLSAYAHPFSIPPLYAKTQSFDSVTTLRDYQTFNLDVGSYHPKRQYSHESVFIGYPAGRYAYAIDRKNPPQYCFWGCGKIITIEDLQTHYFECENRNPSE